MKSFTFIPDAPQKSIFSSYLTEKDRQTTAELREQLLNAETDYEVERIAGQIVRRAARNRTIDNHETLMAIVRTILNELEKDSYFKMYSLAHAMANSKEYGRFCLRNREMHYPIGAIRTVISEMLNEGTLEIKYVKHNGDTTKAYHKK